MKEDTEHNGIRGTLHRVRALPAYWKFIMIFALVVAACLFLSQIQAFCDFYTDRIFPIGLHTYGRVMGLFPFSAGEILIVLAILLAVVQVIFLICLSFLGKKKPFKRLVRWYSKSMLVILLSVVWIMTVNCSVLYHCSRLDINGKRDRDYPVGHVRVLRDYIVEKCNALSERMERDENGDVRTKGDMDGKIREAMRGLSADYPRLSGYYPKPKPLFGSFFMYQSGYDGVYFPFSMEANYNKYISDIRYPHVICHELAHLKGYIYEDEANFLAYLACVGSDDEQMQYAGYLGVLDYIEADYMQGIRSEEDESPLEIAEDVYRDSLSYTDATYEMLEGQEELIDTEIVESISEDFTDAYMEYYDAEPNYEEVTKLLLAYYEGVLY